ncbi:MAG: class I SAM-dependent methyltransferase [Candidatus Odinarchaeum yellowstonii]|uniref:Class I SAM-dependent methyltransferase n=1 Tax=Odinarchaeota yellowstonii (strain LCB_4) TaxID=1841599 RepID=A0AAF0D2F5_ODILC|nr:MAG: class I SAM-dependent methyltransferase [Candidatus Odinarchaeum yellowstonii]
MPDKLGIEAKDFFNEEKAKSYEYNKNVTEIQLKIAERIRELIKLPCEAIILELGCGTGVTSNYFKKTSRVIGLDISVEMLKYAKNKNVEAVNADFKNIPFRDKVFTNIISISSLQWIWGSTPRQVIQKYTSIIKEIKRLIQIGGEVGIQFYPQSEEEFKLVAELFKKEGFTGGIIIDEPNNPRKIKKYLILKIIR